SSATGAPTTTAAMETALRPRDANRLTAGVSPADCLYVGQFEELLRRNPLIGWVTLYDLERRTNWRPDPAIFHAPPSKPLTFSALQQNPTRVVIFSEITNPRHDYDRRRYLRARRRAHKDSSARITRTRVRRPDHARDDPRKQPHRKHRQGDSSPRPRIHGHHRP
ncbi:MAG TPA: hypothetical protein PLK28_20030, partial [Candidatus Rifleibacterium sp.]|nr:hypothetical protein [Candidatus Rifleibacterium sp.]